MQPVSFIVRSEQQVQTFVHTIGGHWHKRSRAEIGAPAVEELMRSVVVVQNDYCISAKLHTEDGTVLLAPFTELEPGVLLRRLMKIPNDGKG